MIVAPSIQPFYIPFSLIPIITLTIAAGKSILSISSEKLSRMSSHIDCTFPCGNLFAPNFFLLFYKSPSCTFIIPFGVFSLLKDVISSPRRPSLPPNLSKKRIYDYVAVFSSHHFGSSSWFKKNPFWLKWKLKRSQRHSGVALIGSYSLLFHENLPIIELMIPLFGLTVADVLEEEFAMPRLSSYYSSNLEKVSILLLLY